MHLELGAREFYGNPMSAYAFAAAYFLAIVWGFLFLKRVSSKRGPALGGDLVAQVRLWELAVVALDVAFRSLELPHRFETALHAVTVLVVAWRVIGLLSALAGFARPSSPTMPTRPAWRPRRPRPSSPAA
jgi:hypothetical protein